MRSKFDHQNNTINQAASISQLQFEQSHDETGHNHFNVHTSTNVRIDATGFIVFY